MKKASRNAECGDCPGIKRSLVAEFTLLCLSLDFVTVTAIFLVDRQRVPRRRRNMADFIHQAENRT
jgi:hypothetical protein